MSDFSKAFGSLGGLMGSTAAGAIGNIASGAAGALFGGIQARRNWKYKKKEMDLQQKYNLENMQKQFDYQQEAWNRENRYNDPRNASARWRLAGISPNAVFGMLTSFEYGTLRRVKERMPQMATCAMTLSPESQLSQPATFWEKLGLKKTDPLVEKLSSPQALSEAAALLEDPSSLDEENSVLIYYLKDRLDFLYSIYPGMNLAEILQQYYYQTDFVNYVAQFGFPVDYVGPEYHAFFRDKDLVPNAHAHGFKVAPWPVGVESRDDLRQLFRLDPELVVTNKPEVAVAILTGLGQWDESSKEG